MWGCVSGVSGAALRSSAKLARAICLPVCGLTLPSKAQRDRASVRRPSVARETHLRHRHELASSGTASHRYPAAHNRTTWEHAPARVPATTALHCP